MYFFLSQINIVAFVYVWRKLKFSIQIGRFSGKVKTNPHKLCIDKNETFLVDNHSFTHPCPSNAIDLRKFLYYLSLHPLQRGKIGA